ncbi:hypothetical protein WBP07_30685 [Novosphingobium sp. BL-8A]|uniref:hypothetical protein n=1 Tax=Novosphingobium sp. BL-8A TaxID=3127639 RepID=UPI003756F960
MRRGYVASLLLAGAGLSAGACAEAAETPSTRLVSCGEESCLLVSGQRADAGAEVRLNGHQVSVEGGRKWKVTLPMDTVRAWSVPMSRAIEVTVIGGGAGGDVAMRADLPIGLLGHVTDLAALEIRSR